VNSKRFNNSIPISVTQKLKKSDFKKEGIDLNKVGKDKMYVLLEKKYKPLTPEIVQKINSGELTL